MTADSPSSEPGKARARPFGNPSTAPGEATIEQKQAYFRKLEDPYAYYAIFGDPEVENPGSEFPTQGVLDLLGDEKMANEVVADSAISRAELEVRLDEVLRLYQPHVARSDWNRVSEYRSSFLSEANKTPAIRARVADRLQKLKFSLLPYEKVEQNRAPAERLIGELRRLLA